MVNLCIYKVLGEVVRIVRVIFLILTRQDKGKFTHESNHKEPVEEARKYPHVAHEKRRCAVD